MDRRVLWSKIRLIHSDQYGNVKCPWCGRVLKNDIAIHEALVPRNAVSPSRQDLIMVPENCVGIHNASCHIPNQGTRALKRQSLKYLLENIPASQIGKWYVGLSLNHNLSIDPGEFPKGENTTEEEWEDYLWKTLT